LERQRFFASLNENSEKEAAKAEGIAEGMALSDAKWQKVVAENEAELARFRAMLANKK
jgi:hypothetical protein